MLYVYYEFVHHIRTFDKFLSN